MSDLTPRQAFVHLVECEWAGTEFEHQCPGHIAARKRIGRANAKEFEAALHKAMFLVCQEA